jgi:ubiquinone/menaquinone biosynthesis C-methylase UbiE
MNSTISVNSPQWDYTAHAATYYLRPNYAPAAIDRLCQTVGAKPENYLIADIGAGTGNLTLLFLERRLRCIAVEPNAAMRQIGLERTEGMAVEWVVGNGETTNLPSGSADLFAMGSSFNCTDRQQTLTEAHRVLKPTGYFTCMWNNRDLERDPVQKRVEEIIRSVIPDYSHGTRREDQSDVILASKLFKDVVYFEASQQVERTLDQYVEAWKSVRNQFWDLNTAEGKQLFDHLMAKVCQELQTLPKLELTYVTRVWIARRVD